MYIGIYIDMYVYMDVHLYIHIYLFIYVYIYICIYIYLYLCYICIKSTHFLVDESTIQIPCTSIPAVYKYLCVHDEYMYARKCLDHSNI